MTELEFVSEAVKNYRTAFQGLNQLDEWRITSHKIWDYLYDHIHENMLPTLERHFNLIDNDPHCWGWAGRHSYLLNDWSELHALEQLEQILIESRG